MSEELKFCSNCGKQQSKTHKVCEQCGYNFETREVLNHSNVQPVETKKKKISLSNLGIIVGLIALIIVGIYYFRNTSSPENPIAGTYVPEGLTSEDGMVVIDEDYYTQFIVMSEEEEGRASQIVNFFMKPEDENLYVVDLAEGFIVELVFQGDPEMVAVIEQEFHDTTDEELINEMGLTTVNNGDNFTVKSKVLTNAELWEYDLFYSEDFNLEKVGDNLVLNDEWLIKQPVD